MVYGTLEVAVSKQIKKKKTGLDSLQLNRYDTTVYYLIIEAKSKAYSIIIPPSKMKMFSSETTKVQISTVGKTFSSPLQMEIRE